MCIHTTSVLPHRCLFPCNKRWPIKSYTCHQTNKSINSDKAVHFSLPSETAAVFFNRELVPIFEVLAELPDGTGLLGALRVRLLWCMCKRGV